MIRILSATAFALSLVALAASPASAAGKGDFAKAFETSCATKAARENVPMDCGCQVRIMREELGEEQADRLFEISWLDHFAERNERNAERKRNVSSEMGDMGELQNILDAGRKARTECKL